LKLVRRAGDDLWRQWDPHRDDCMDRGIETMDVEPVALANRIVELESELASVRTTWQQEIAIRDRMVRELIDAVYRACDWDDGTRIGRAMASAIRTLDERGDA
jgi:hypothetical protein